MEILIIIFLVIFSGLFSGLTLGLLSLQKDELERKMKLKDPVISKQAKKVYSVRKNGNLLLCTLLLGNVAVNTVLSIFLGEMGDGVVAAITATALIVVFGEILPQAFVAKHALNVGSKTTFIVKVFQFLLYPLVKPLSVGLDKLLGEEMPTIYSKKEIREIIRTHEDSDESEIDIDEESIVIGALTFSDKIVSKVMTPKSVVYMLDKETAIDETLIAEIKRKGHTRVPVYDNDTDNIVGVLLTKSLIGVTDGLVKEYTKDKFIEVKQDDKLDNILNYFTKNKQHIAIVRNEYDTVVGIVTLEDIIEEIINREIVDETDRHENMRDLLKK